MIPVTHGYARVIKTDDVTRNLETQLHTLQEFGIREEHIFTDEMTGSSMVRPAWNELMNRVRPNDTIVVAWLDRFSRNFDEGVRIQAERHQVEHWHSGHQGGHQHRRRQRRSQTLSDVNGGGKVGRVGGRYSPILRLLRRAHWQPRGTH